MQHTHPENITIGPDGSRTTTPPKIITSDESLYGSHNGSTCVHAGTYTIARGASSNGSVRIVDGATLIVDGSQNGSLTADDGAIVEIRGQHNGSLHVEPGALVRVAPGGRLAGSVNVGGTVENAGTRGGSVHRYGRGTIRDLPGSTVKEPDSTANGAQIYRW